MNQELNKSESHWRIARQLTRALWHEQMPSMRVRLIASLTFLFAGKLATIAVPFLLKATIDTLSNPGHTSFWLPFGIILAYGAARFSTQLFNELRDISFVQVSNGTQRKILISTFNHLHKLSLHFHLSRQTGAVSRIIERGGRGMQFTFQFMTFNIVPTLVEILLVSFILLLNFEARFAIITVATVTSYILYTLIVTERRTPYRREMNAQDSAANHAMVESLLNYETVKYFGNEHHEANQYEKLLIEYDKAAAATQRLSALLNSGQAGIIALGLIAVMGFAVEGVESGKLTIGDFVLVNTFLIQLYLPLNLLGFVYREIKQGLIDLDKIFELNDLLPEVSDPADAAPLRSVQGRIVFDSVSFRYDERRPILKNVSFTIEPGQTVAIVGPSGSGKSTLARLLYRFFDVTAGSISIDGTDIRTVRQEDLRRLIGIVPQDTVLFNRSIQYNIQYGRLKATHEEVIRAAQLAYIHDFITSLPDGYETTVGERGLELSGGEKQRVALARMILKDPPIIILDEATSALDTHTEEAIQQDLKKATERRTALVIAHRLSTIVDADQILVLRKGSIVEQGTHDQLLAAGGVYATLWERQSAQT